MHSSGDVWEVSIVGGSACGEDNDVIVPAFSHLLFDLFGLNPSHSGSMNSAIYSSEL